MLLLHSGSILKVSALQNADEAAAANFSFLLSRSWSHVNNLGFEERNEKCDKVIDGTFLMSQHPVTE